MSKVSTSYLPVIALFAVCSLIGVCRGEQEPAPEPLAHYRFNGDAKDAKGVHADFELENTAFKDDALYLNGHYELSVEKGGYRAICRTSGLDIAGYTVALRFKSEPHRIEEFRSFRSNLFTGGVSSYRWFGLQRSQNGNLVVMLNNGLFRHEIKGVALEHHKWTVVACSVDIPARTVIAAVNGKQVSIIRLPMDFKVIDLPKGIRLPKELEGRDVKLRTMLMQKDTKKEWSFTDYGHGRCFHGLVDEILIYGRALTAGELEKIPLRP
ncbi:hypothetical protein Fuma_06314 [Fuerstiella marisgermanici]|uniref:LamG domain-containing protein n=2 Tax=Fuerstiella marisgermanici TaxID=1891926 RepID=A0A1P8WRF0_9PLAN|nr:hypothetical protein Fuma_06314 [Fuerstiella marisgermanici]